MAIIMPYIKEKLIWSMYFFKMGVIQNFGVSDYEMDFSKVERAFTNPEHVSSTKNSKFCFRDYAIGTHSIKIDEQWQSINGAFQV